MDSRFFDANQRIKTIPTTPAPAIAAPAAPVPAAPMAAAPTPVVAPVAAPLSISDLLIASLLSHNGGLAGFFPNIQQAAPQRPRTPVPAQAYSRTALPSPIKRHSVTTDQFCERYEIDGPDCALLKQIGFKPGDLTDAKLDEDLKDAGFTIFSWKRVHLANLRFKADLSAGVFDE